MLQPGQRVLEPVLLRFLLVVRFLELGLLTFHLGQLVLEPVLPRLQLGLRFFVLCLLTCYCFLALDSFFEMVDTFEEFLNGMCTLYDLPLFSSSGWVVWGD